MKYIITESKLGNIIKDYILKRYDVIDVELTTKTVYLGSGPDKKGRTQYEKNVIEVYIDNIKKKKTHQEIMDIKRKLWNQLISLFGLRLDKYGSEWGLTVFEVKREEI